MFDKALKNEAMDVMNINLPESIKQKDTEQRDHLTFVYAAYLPPGLHTFLIYDPKLKQIYCKDVLVDLAKSDCFPEYPRPMNKPIAKAKTKQNVWRKWREDSQLDIELAQVEDFDKDHYEPTLFIRNEIDIVRCRQYLE